MGTKDGHNLIALTIFSPQTPNAKMFCSSMCTTESCQHVASHHSPLPFPGHQPWPSHCPLAQESLVHWTENLNKQTKRFTWFCLEIVLELGILPVQCSYPCPQNPPQTLLSEHSACVTNSFTDTSFKTALRASIPRTVTVASSQGSYPNSEQHCTDTVTIIPLDTKDFPLGPVSHIIR